MAELGIYLIKINNLRCLHCEQEIDTTANKENTVSKKKVNEDILTLITESFLVVKKGINKDSVPKKSSMHFEETELMN